VGELRVEGLEQLGVAPERWGKPHGWSMEEGRGAGSSVVGLGEPVVEGIEVVGEAGYTAAASASACAEEFADGSVGPSEEASAAEELGGLA